MKTTKERLATAIHTSLNETLSFYKTSLTGLTEEQVEKNRDLYGENTITKGQEDSILKKIYESIINPFTIILLVIAVISLVTNVWLAKPGQEDPTTSIIIVVLVLISGGIRFVQELRSDKAATNLSKMIVNTATVIRQGEIQEVPIDDLVVGDVVKLSAGDMIPADLLLFESRDFFVQQSGLTGESESVEKLALTKATVQQSDSLLEAEALAFMGTNVLSGSAKAVVLAVGDDTMMGAIEQTLNTYEEPTSFEREMNSISWLLIRLMLVMVPIVFLSNGLTDGDWLEAGVFALSVGVGLTPEMLPMIITASLAKGSIIMAKEKVVIKKLNAIQDLGAIDILCTDKTGTLTQDEIVLEYPLDIHGELDLSVLRRAYLNSYFQTGLKNLMDRAIISRTEKEAKEHAILQNLDTSFQKIDELPFDFERRRMSVIVKDDSNVVSMVTKGALEEMLTISTHVEYRGEIIPLTEGIRQEVLAEVGQLNRQGLRVLGVGYKSGLREDYAYAVTDESDMILTGYLAFLDPPKPSAAPAIQALLEHGVRTKILTGDNEKVTQAICEKVGLDVEHMLLGADIDQMTDQELAEAVESVTVFAKLSPDQKARIILQLKKNGHGVGYMGDGINDAPSMKVADVGISVDKALVDKARGASLSAVHLGFQDYAGLKKTVVMTAEVIGTDEARSRALSYIKYLEGNLQKVTDKTASLSESERPKVLHIAGGSDVTKVDGSDSIIGEWMKAAGARNSIDGVANYKNISVEQIISSAPDQIIIGNSDAQKGIDTITSDTAWADVPAVKNGKLYRNPVGTFKWDRYSTEEALQILWAAQHFHPDLFADINLVHETQTFYRTYYNYELSDEEAQRILAGDNPGT